MNHYSSPTVGAERASAKLTRPKRRAFWFYRCVLRSHCFRLAPLAENAIHQESPAVGCPPYICQPVLAFSSNFFGSITHRGGRDARVPVRRRFAAIVCLSADIGRIGFGGAFWCT
ncbi:MAG: hypothetical protein LBQ66_11295, partial [Planctomycetaceae bacterium]|nr:hypothetical protein [Planctomycetaceae bacterium]